jgi:hypothetical protein
MGVKAGDHEEEGKEEGLIRRDNDMRRRFFESIITDIENGGAVGLTKLKENQNLCRTYAFPFSGDSGGAVLNAAGELMGIVSGQKGENSFNFTYIHPTRADLDALIP